MLLLPLYLFSVFCVTVDSMQAMPEILIETFHYFSWLNPLLDLGQKRMLQENDMYNILPEDQAEILGEELQRYLNTSSDVQMSCSESERCCSHECYQTF